MDEGEATETDNFPLQLQTITNIKKVKHKTENERNHFFSWI